MKLKESIIVIGKLVNRNQIFRGIRHMKNIFKNKITIMRMYSSLTNVAYGYT
jgi:hypothetical protein